MSTEKKKEQQLLEELSAQPAARSSYSTAGLSSRREVENALAKAEYSPSQSVTDAAADLKISERTLYRKIKEYNLE